MTETEKPRAEVYSAVLLERDEDCCNHIVVVAGSVSMYEKAGDRAFTMGCRRRDCSHCIAEHFDPDPCSRATDVVRLIVQTTCLNDGGDDGAA